MAHDPRAGSLRAHDGRHPMVISRMVAHELFTKWVKKAKPIVDNLASGDGAGATISVALYCNRGRHRSVAAAIVLAHVANKSGVFCTPLQHMSLQPCNCNQCGGNERERSAALRKAWAIWKALP